MPAFSYVAIDADGHILEPLDLWDKYIDPEFRERRPRFVIDDNGKERLTVEGKLLGNPRGIGSLGSVGARQGIVKPGTLKYAEGRKGGFDPHARIVDMDADGIDAAFLYPSLGLFAGAVEDPGLAGAMCRAYNRWLADYCSPYPDRLFGVAMLPMQSVDLAIEEMRFARQQLGMRGGFLRPNPYHGKKMINDPIYEPFTKTLTPGEAENYWSQLGERSAEAFIYDASYVKLRQVTLGYSFPRALLSRTPFTNLMLSFVGRNLAILHKNVDNIDPESSYTNSNAQGLDYFGMPATRTYGFNLRVTF